MKKVFNFIQKICFVLFFVCMAYVLVGMMYFNSMGTSMSHTSTALIVAGISLVVGIVATMLKK